MTKSRFNKKSSLIIKSITVLFCLALTMLLFVSCDNEEPIKSKEEILSLMSSESDTELIYATEYFERWGITNFQESKMRGVEVLFRDYYVEDMPKAIDHAKEAGTLFVENMYDSIDLTDKAEVTHAIINCYIEVVGDPYSVYRDTSEYESYDTDMSGTFTGIGVSIEYNYIEKTMRVVEVYSSSGAEEAGILAGDYLYKVGDQLISQMEYSDIINSIRGEGGSSVNITVKRGETEITMDVVRRKVVEESVKYTFDSNTRIGYIKISSFKENTAKQFREAIDYMEDNGATGIIYDLRSNPGGYLDTVVSMLSYIAPKGTQIVSFSNNYASPMKADDPHTLSLPSVIICNGNTASAGELFVCAMRDFSRAGLFSAKIVGTTTFGKGIMQRTIPFTDGSALTLTVAYYNPPSGKNYHGVGIVPDIEVSNTQGEDLQLKTAQEEILKLIK